MYCYT